MEIKTLPDGLVERGAHDSRILLVVLDGVGGLPDPRHGKTELEAARTPNLDALAASSSLGCHVPVAPGVTPGSGPGHLALFGYDPLAYQIGRGALSALGVGFDLQPGDLAVRLNLATLDADGRVADRRAGRPADDQARPVVDRIRTALDAFGQDGVELFIEHVKEHRAVLVVRGGRLADDLADTDPQETGVPPLPVRAASPDSAPTVDLVTRILGTIRESMAAERVINGVLARGFAMYEGFPTFQDRYGLDPLAVAQYPMYRGVARLVGMQVKGVPGSDEEAVATVEAELAHHDFVFLHFKAPDARGEDGDFDAKVGVLENLDGLMPRLAALEPDVLLVTGDHSTPATYGAHTWHAVPTLLHSRWARPTADRFGEDTCRTGDLGRVRGQDLMSLALAHAGRLAKFGA